MKKDLHKIGGKKGPDKLKIYQETIITGEENIRMLGGDWGKALGVEKGEGGFR